MKQLLFSCMHRTSECPSFISSCQFTKRSKRWIVSTSDSKEDGCTVIAEVFTWSHPEPRSQALPRLSQYCGTRVHGKGSHCAPLLSLGILSRFGGLGRLLFRAGLFCILCNNSRFIIYVKYNREQRLRWRLKL